MATRRRFLATVAAATAGLAGCAGGDREEGTPRGTRGGDGAGGRAETGTVARTTSRTESQGGTGTGTDGSSEGETRVGLRTVATGFRAPVAFVDSGERRYVADQPGTAYVLRDGGPEPFLDLTDAVVTGGERGLLGLALHPDYGENRRLFVRYSAPPRPGTPEGYDHTFVLSEFRADDDGLGVDPGTERTLLEIPEPQSNHNSGSLAVGPGGYLYVGVGDGGAADDRGRGHVEDWYDGVPGGNGQDVTENLLGSLLRIDPDARTGGKPYGIPEDNPLVGTAGLDEHYAWGLRNPWGISFDGDDLYLADVGQNRAEEVNLIEKGGNYGWNVREGTRCFGPDGCPTATPDGQRLLGPVIEYRHSGGPVSGSAVIGGYRYRGDALDLQGVYVFGDLNANGRLFRASPADGGTWPTSVLEVAPGDRETLDTLLAFGRDRSGELYACTPSGVHELVPARY